MSRATAAPAARPTTGSSSTHMSAVRRQRQRPGLSSRHRRRRKGKGTMRMDATTRSAAIAAMGRYEKAGIAQSVTVSTTSAFMNCEIVWVAPRFWLSAVRTKTCRARGVCTLSSKAWRF
eukprot:4758757-Prymnesium_polylepis.1